MEIYAVSSPAENANPNQESNPNSNRVMPQPVNQSLPMQQPYPRTLPPIQRDQANMGVMPQPVNQSQPPQPVNQSQLPQPVNQSQLPQPVNQSQPPPLPPRPQHFRHPYPNTIHPIQREQPNSAKLVTPPRDFLIWSIANTVCAVLFSCWA